MRNLRKSMDSIMRGLEYVEKSNRIPYLENEVKTLEKLCLDYNEEVMYQDILINIHEIKFMIDMIFMLMELIKNKNIIMKKIKTWKFEVERHNNESGCYFTAQASIDEACITTQANTIDELHRNIADALRGYYNGGVGSVPYTLIFKKDNFKITNTEEEK